MSLFLLDYMIKRDFINLLGKEWLEHYMLELAANMVINPLKLVSYLQKIFREQKKKLHKSVTAWKMSAIRERAYLRNAGGSAQFLCRTITQ